MSDDSNNKVLVSSGASASSDNLSIDTRPATITDLGLTTYATVLSGSWVAYASNGTTFYSSGKSVVSGDIDLGYNASLDIKSGAVVSGIRGGTTYPHITIESGGTLEHSNIYDGYVKISSGGLSYRNLLNDDTTIVSSGGTSLNDTVTSYPMSVMNGGTAENTIVSSGGTLIVSSGGSATNINALDNARVSGASSSYISGYILNGSAFLSDYGVIDGGGTKAASSTSSVTGKTILSGVWSAVNSNGTTLYVQSGKQVSGNVELGYAATLNIKSGATVSNLNVVSNYIDTINVSSGGTLENSTFPNGYLYVSSGGVTKNNNLNSDPVYYYAGATSINDTFYDSGYAAGDAAYVYSGATMENPYISSGGIVSNYAGGTIINPTQNGGTLFQSSYNFQSGGTLTGTWSAVNSNGTTIYQSGAQVVSGDVTLGGNATLKVMSGANANNVQTIGSLLAFPTIIISSGGTLSDSDVENGWVSVGSGATALHDLYNSTPVYISSGAVDSSGTYINNSALYLAGDGGTVYSGGTAINDVASGNSGYLTVLGGGTQSGGSVVSGGTLTVSSGGITSGGTVVAGGVENAYGTGYDIKVSSGGVLNFTGTSYNSANVDSRASLTLPSSSFLLNAGTWQAISSNGTILYESAYSSGQLTRYVASSGSLVNAGAPKSAGTTILSGDMDVATGVTVEITSGATVSGLNTASGGIATIIVDSAATLESSYLQNGYAYISSGGVAISNVYNSTPVYVSSGGVDSDGTHFISNGYDAIAGATAYSGGSVINPYISAGGTVVQSSGGVVTNATIVSGGAYEEVTGGINLPTSASTLLGSWKVVNSNGTNLYESAYSSGQKGIQVLSNGTLVSGATASAAGTTILTGNVTLSGGATLEITSGVNVSGLDTTSGGIATVKVDSGATLTSSYIENGYVSLGVGASGYGNVYNSTPVYISSGAVDSQGSYYNYIYAAGDGGTVYNGGALMSPLVSNGGSITVSSGGLVDSPTAVGGGHIYIVSGGVNTCFLEGTLVKTPDGLKPIETLQPNEYVTCFKEGHETSEEIKWVGIGRSYFAHKGTASPANIEDFPIRVKKDAFGENRPFKDLLLTAEHALYFEGNLVPVRMLVNGRSIFYDISIKDYLYYHIETASHNLILADGVLSETYFDTGNRETFNHAQYFLEGFKEQVIERGALLWNENSVAPLNVTRGFVEPLYRLFEQRAEAIGLEKQHYPWQEEERGNAQKIKRSVHLMTDKKEVIYPMRERGDYILFKLPASTKELYLRSHIARPADVIGSFIDDRRNLGVLVGEIKMISFENERIITQHLEEKSLEGWSVIENASCRWTAGNARIPLPYEENYSHECILALRILDFCA